MIEKSILDYMTDHLDVTVAMEVPKNPPPRFVVLEKTGSSCVNHLNTATIAAQSYAESLAEAAKLNSVVKRAFFDMEAENGISDVYLNSDYNFTDTTTKKYRYQALFVITYFERS